MNSCPSWRRRLAVRGVFWRQYLDWAITNVPFYMQPVLLWFSTLFFFFFAAPARRAVTANLAIVLPRSSWWMNQIRAFRTLHNFAWTITDAAIYKLNKATFAYEIEGEANLDQLTSARGAIVLTAHMGNYDLGAALFAQKFNRPLRMVRAPEADEHSAEYLNASLQEIGDGAVKIDYNTKGALLSFDLLNALRSGEIVSIQGDRVAGNAGETVARLFDTEVRLPTGPFILGFAAQAPIYPLFIARIGYRRYKIIVREPIRLSRHGRDRKTEISVAVEHWCRVLEQVIAEHWTQWFAFTPIFARHPET